MMYMHYYLCIWVNPLMVYWSKWYVLGHWAWKSCLASKIYVSVDLPNINILLHMPLDLIHAICTPFNCFSILIQDKQNNRVVSNVWNSRTLKLPIIINFEHRFICVENTSENLNWKPTHNLRKPIKSLLCGIFTVSMTCHHKEISLDHPRSHHGSECYMGTLFSKRLKNNVLLNV